MVGAPTPRLVRGESISERFLAAPEGKAASHSLGGIVARCTVKLHHGSTTRPHSGQVSLPGPSPCSEVLEASRHGAAACTLLLSDQSIQALMHGGKALARPGTAVRWNVLKATNAAQGSQMPKLKKESSKKSNDRKRSSRQNEPGISGRQQSRFDIQAGESDEEVIRAFIEECFVPILAEHFMRERK